MKITQIDGEESESADEHHARNAGIEETSRHRDSGQGQRKQPQRIAADVERAATVGIRRLGKDEEEPHAHDGRAEQGKSKSAVLETGVPGRSREQCEAGDSEKDR